jgi:hypothetical protein
MATMQDVIQNKIAQNKNTIPTTANGSVDFQALDKINGLTGTNGVNQNPGYNPMYDTNFANLNIVNGLNNNDGQYTYGSGGSMAYGQTPDGSALTQAIKDRLNAVQDITDLSNQYASGAQTYVNNLSKKTTKQGFDMQGFLDNYMKYMKGSYDSSKLGETALANQKMTQDLLAQEANKRQGEKNYNDTVSGINNDVYNAYENAKVTGMERGINYSAQQAGVNAGIASRALNNIQQAKEVRDLSLASIKDKIDAIKSGNLAEIQNIEATYNAKLQEAMGNAYMKGTEHQWDAENMANQNAYTQDNMAVQQGYDLEKIKANQANTLENMGLQQKYDLEKLNLNNQNDMAKLDKMYEQDLNKMQIDQNYKKELQNMDYAFKKDFLKLETNEKKNLMAFDTEQQKIIMNLDQAHKMSILGAQAGIDNAQLQAKYQYESQNAMRDILGSIMLNDPNFTAYPSTAEQGKMMTDLLNVMGGKTTVDQFVNNNYKNLPSGKKEESKQKVTSILDMFKSIGKSNVNGTYNPSAGGIYEY